MNKYKLVGLFLLLGIGFILASCAAKVMYQVAFDSRGGDAVESIEMDRGSLIPIPNVEKEGYSLEGWYTSLDQGLTLNEKWSFSDDLVSSDLTLYANWTINQYSILFESNGGSTVESITQDYGTTVNMPQDPTKEDHDFDGWYINSSLTTEYNPSTILEEDITLYAKWTFNDGLVHIDHLNILYVPSRDTLPLVQGISYLPEILIAELLTLGYVVESINADIGTSYEAVGEALESGTVDIGFIPSSTYAAHSYSGNIEAILGSTRTALSKDSTNPKDWNDGEPTVFDLELQSLYYRSIGVAGPSVKGRELANKINNDQPITWEDLQTVKIAVQSHVSLSGRVYPSLLFSSLYNGNTITDLPSVNIVQCPGYGNALAALASGEVDIAFIYADARMDYADEWIFDGEGGYSRTASIWEETDVVFVTEGIYLDTISVSKSTVDANLQVALEQAFMNLIDDETPLENPAGMFNVVKDIFLVYNHVGYQRVDDSDYEFVRAAYELINN